MPPEIDSTIQSDVPNDTAAAAETQKSPRELEMERIGARHEQQMAAEAGVELPVEAAPAPTPAPVSAADDQLATQLAADSNADPSHGALPQRVKVKIDGQEAEVPLDEVVREYQKKGAADARMREAARLQKEAADLQQQLLAQQQQLLQQQQQQQPAATPNSADPAGEPDEAGKEFLHALFSGDEETALAKLGELTKGRQPQSAAQPTLDIDQLTQAVTQHVQQKLVVESALQQHRKDYPQVYADPDMEQFVLTKVNNIRAAEGGDFFDVLNRVSADFSTKFGWQQAASDPGRPADPAPTTNSRVTKLERKEAIDNIPSMHTKTTSTEPVPEQANDIIAQMRAARAGG